MIAINTRLAIKPCEENETYDLILTHAPKRNPCSKSYLF